MISASTIGWRVLQETGDTSSPGVMRVLPISADRSSSNIYDFVDNALKEKYWYYLTKATLLYLSNVDRIDGAYQFLSVVKNIDITFTQLFIWIDKTIYHNSYCCLFINEIICSNFFYIINLPKNIGFIGQVNFTHKLNFNPILIFYLFLT